MMLADMGYYYMNYLKHCNFLKNVLVANFNKRLIKNIINFYR